MNNFVMFLLVESGLHAGGDESIGSIDEPVHRNKITRYPVIHGQSLKGAERRQYAARRGDGATTDSLFGSPPPADATAGGNLKQGSLDVGEAQLVAFPVPTLKRTYAWVTSPLCLSNLARVAARAGLVDPPPLIDRLNEDSALVAGSAWANGVLDFGDFWIDAGHVSQSAQASEWAAWIANQLPDDPKLAYVRKKLADDFIVVADHVLTELATEFTEINARVQLDDDKTVAQGPFYTEYVPQDTIFAAFHGCGRGVNDDGATSIRSAFDGTAWTIGGDESIGKGIVWTSIVEGIV